MSTAIRDKIIELCAARGPSATVCSSDVARALASDEARWRELMPDVRTEAQKLVVSGVIVATQRGKPVVPLAVKGPIRLGILPRRRSER